MAAKKINSSTQRFTDIKAITQDIVLFQNGNACLIIEVRAVNFALMAKDEQDAKIYSYAALLNSLSYSIQIYIRSKKINISSYLNLLSLEINKTNNQLLANHILLYRNFVEQLVKVNTVLDKQFYIIIPYNPLERGVGGNVPVAKNKAQSSVEQARNILHSKASALLTQLASLNLPAKTLSSEELIRLFYSIYNEGEAPLVPEALDTKTTVIKVNQASSKQ